jgi:hypothetical protein
MEEWAWVEAQGLEVLGDSVVEEESILMIYLTWVSVALAEDLGEEVDKDKEEHDLKVVKEHIHLALEEEEDQEDLDFKCEIFCILIKFFE